MVDWNKKFAAEYQYARGWLANSKNFAEDWQPLIRRLHKAMTDEGFDPGESSALSDLRKRSLKASSGLLAKAATPDKAILDAVNAWSENGSGLVDDKAKMRAAALKLLKHVYLISKSGNRKVWVVSLPTELQDWPSDDFNARADTQLAVRNLLKANTEHFTEERKRDLSASTFHALAWCQKTTALLANAAKGLGPKADKKNMGALAVVKRWFGDPATTDAEMTNYIATLMAGFKKITAQLNKGHLVLTDWVPLRTASTQDEIDFLNSEAFTFASRSEGMDVVYIEKSFFVDHPGNVLKGTKNWTRIVVHELTHLVCGTEDVNIGNARYAWYGIGPHSGYPGSAAIRNADNWAFFSADCAGQLTDGERAVALKII